MFNLMKTAILMAAITALFMFLGQMFGGQNGMMLALAIALGLNFFSYWFSDKIVLRMYSAREVDDASAPQFVGMIRDLAGRAGLPMPRVYLIDEQAPNAFATGRNPAHAAVAATTGIVQLLSERELRGVIAHELAHLLEPHHGPNLWRILDRSLPDWRDRSEELRVKARDIYWCHDRMNNR